ncbi:Gfo/Idh/MocA family protein [Krasilnikovia sp. MM14-A1004]|uniref:Gfo/Idh/MocA family protein n=1 Tax=Krasilnikovia sp. MM14-A1004 TaxID=3373541 RepID=UPI00399D2056
MSGPRRLRAGLIGLGAMGRNHARVLAGLDGVDFVGAQDPAGDPGGSLPVPVVTDLADLLALGLDYAVVACPTALHETVGLELAAHGVCALIEKPLALSVEEARRLVEAFESRGLVAGVGHIERYNPALRSLRTRLEASELGEVFQVVTRRQGPFPHRISDVGVVLDLATHDIDLTGWVTGQVYVSIAARTVSRSGRPHEDMLAAVGQLADGAMVNHLVNWLSPLKERSTVVTGDRGCYVADTLTADLTYYANAAIDTEWEALRTFVGVSQGDMVRYAIPKREPLLIEHELFRDAVDGKVAGIVSLREGLRTVEVAAAALASAREGVTMPVHSAEPAARHPRQRHSERVLNPASVADE